MKYNIYDIDFRKLARWLLPKSLRSAEMIAWIYALIIPVIHTYQLFLKYRKAIDYQLLITPQVCYLERLLNDRFDFSLRGIRIVDGIHSNPVYLFQEEELKAIELYQEAEGIPMPLYSDSEAGTIKDDFIVQVPARIIFDENELRSLLDNYKLAGKRYKVEKV